jgi:hypothetical protein
MAFSRGLSYSRRVDPRWLAAAFLLVMGSALGCFLTAFAWRKRDKRRHMRWGLSGAAIDLAGTAVVFVTTKALGWHVPPRDAAWVEPHRVLAYVATALLLLQAGTGIARARAHPFLGLVFLPVYAVTYVVAALAYAPF